MDFYKGLNNRSDWLVAEIKKLNQSIIDQLYNQGYITDECQVKTKLRRIIREIIDPRIEQIKRSYPH